MRTRLAVSLLALALLAPALTGCLGVENMDDLKARLGAAEALPAPPVAAATATPLRAVAGDAVAFSAEASLDPAAAGLDYRWEFGDGADGLGVTTTHAYQRAGTYVATLTVEDVHGRTANDTVQVQVAAPDAPPEARLRVTDDRGADVESTRLGTTLRFSAADSRDPEGGPLAYQWDFGDGATGTGAEATHAYDAPGVYLAEVTVRDAAGQTDAASRLIAVNYHEVFRGTLQQPGGDADHAFPMGHAARLTVFLAFDAGVGGTQDLNLAIEDADGNVVANATTATSPGATGRQEERVSLTRDAIVPFATGEWTARVTLEGGIQVDYTLTVDAAY